MHYTSPKFHNLLKKYNIQQSMSRRGNCWDNAPQESYFGHMKDELNLDTCFTFRDVCNEIKEYIEYYNNFRYQWNLKKDDSCSIQKSSFRIHYLIRLFLFSP